MSKTYTFTQDSEGHKIRKCSKYIINDPNKRITSVRLLTEDKTSEVGLNRDFYAPNSPITAESYASLIENANSVTDKTITISSDSAKLISEYCTYNPTTKTANTLISDANTKGFGVKVGNYTLLPSLSFDGSHYIDSGIIPNNNSSILIDFKVTACNSWVFGSRESNSSKQFDYLKNSENTDFLGFGSYRYSGHVITKDERTIIEYINSNLKVNGTTLSTQSSQSFTCPGTMYIGAHNNNNSTVIDAGQVIIYSVNLNDNLFIPANNGTTDGLLNLSTLVFYPLISI